MNSIWPEGKTFNSLAVCQIINQFDHLHQDTLREFFYPTLEHGKKATSKSLGRLIMNHIDNPVKVDDKTLILKSARDAATVGGKGPRDFWVEVKAQGAS